MLRSFVKLNGVPAKLLTLGEEVSKKPKKIILIFPGEHVKTKRIIKDT